MSVAQGMKLPWPNMKGSNVTHMRQDDRTDYPSHAELGRETRQGSRPTESRELKGRGRLGYEGQIQLETIVRAAKRKAGNAANSAGRD